MTRLIEAMSRNWRLNVRTDEIDNEAAIVYLPAGAWKDVSLCSGGIGPKVADKLATSVGVIVPKVKDRREITIYGGSCQSRAYKEEAKREKKINEDVVTTHT